MKEINELVALLGGVTIDVTNRKGEMSQVRVRELRIAEYEKLLPIVDNEEASAALYCDQTEEWAANLTTESLEAVIDKAETINMNPFERWVTRRKNRTTRVGVALGAIRPTKDAG